MVATFGLLWLPVTLLPVAAAFGYQYKALAVQGILQLCETPVLFCMCPSVLLYQADSKHFLSSIGLARVQCGCLMETVKLKYFCVKNRHLEVSSDEECTF